MSRWDYDSNGRPERIGDLGVTPRWFESRLWIVALGVGVGAGLAWWWWR